MIVRNLRSSIRRAALAPLPSPVVAATAVRSCAPVLSQDAETQQSHPQLAVTDELQFAVCQYTVLDPHVIT